MTITAAEVADGGTSNNATIALTFTSSEATTDFAEADITVAGGDLITKSYSQQKGFRHRVHEVNTSGKS